MIVDELAVNMAKLVDLDISAFKFFLKRYIDLEVESEEEIVNYLSNFHLIEKETLTPTIAGILFLVLSRRDL
jgi:predicted HTH transcriptional regulator